MLLVLGTTLLRAQVRENPPVARDSFEERPFSLDAEVEQKYSITKMTLQNPMKLRLNYKTPNDSYRVGLGYSFTPQTREHAVSMGLRFHILSFGKRR